MIKKLVFCAALILAAVSVATAEIKNKYLAIDLPAGWEEVKMPSSNAPGLTLMFANKKLNCAVSLSIADTDQSAKDAVMMTREQMQKNPKFQLGELEEKDGLFTYSITQKPATGWVYYGSNGKQLAITTIWSPKLENAREFFEALKPVDPALFPKLQ